MPTLVEIGQRIRIQTHQVQDRGVNIAHVDRFVRATEAELVGGSYGGASLDSRPGEPSHHRVSVVVAPHTVSICSAGNERSTAHLCGEDQERLV